MTLRPKRRLTTAELHQRAVESAELADEMFERTMQISAEIRERARRHLQSLKYANLPWYQRLFTRPENVTVPEWKVRVVARTWIIENPTRRDAADDMMMFLSRASGYGNAARARAELDP